MAASHDKLLSLIVPVFNEQDTIPDFYDRLRSVIESLQHTHPTYRTEIVFINDGSSDNTGNALNACVQQDARCRVIEFTRNFGKEIATTAGIHAAVGDACIILDADLQHPPEYIPEFLSQWEGGAQMVVGVREHDTDRALMDRVSSWVFYQTMRRIAESDMQFIPRATDFRLLDRTVMDVFSRLTEHNRLMRGLTDWLGFRTVHVPIKVPQRAHGHTRYTQLKRFRLAVSVFISHSLFPLKLAGYLGLFIIVSSGLLGLSILITQYLFSESPFIFSGPAQLAILNVFLIGIVLSCLGLIALYIGQIHHEVANRPLYIVSRRINFDTPARHDDPEDML